MRAVKDSLAVPLRAKWEVRRPSRGVWHVSGNRLRSNQRVGRVKNICQWVGGWEHCAQWGTLRAIRGRGKQASLEGPSLVTRCGLACGTARLGASGLGGWEVWPFWASGGNV